MKMTLKQAISKQAAARSRYAAAAREFRESMAELGALDQMLSNRGVDSRGFGVPPDVFLLRHAIGWRWSLSQPASLLEHWWVMLSHSGVIATRRNARSLMRLANRIPANPISSPPIAKHNWAGPPSPRKTAPLIARNTHGLAGERKRRAKTARLPDDRISATLHNETRSLT
jgi:hypothetical protein